MTATSGPFRVTYTADLYIDDPAKYESGDPSVILVNQISSLIAEHGREQGFRLVGDQSAEVTASPISE